MHAFLNQAKCNCKKKKEKKNKKWGRKQIVVCVFFNSIYLLTHITKKKFGVRSSELIQWLNNYFKDPVSFHFSVCLLLLF